MTVLKAKIGGAYQSVLAGYASNVFVGPNPPTDPNIEFWVDTDATLPAVPWTPVTVFTNGWTATSAGGVGPVRYRKISDVVYLEGSILPGTFQQPAFNLPAGFRPPADRYFSTVAGTSPNVTIVGSNGNIIVWSGSGGCGIQCSFSVTP